MRKGRGKRGVAEGAAGGLPYEPACTPSTEMVGGVEVRSLACVTESHGLNSNAPKGMYLLDRPVLQHDASTGMASLPTDLLCDVQADHQQDVYTSVLGNC
jgi:hypothetical protein